MKSQWQELLWFSRIVFLLSLGLLFLSTGCANPSMPAAPLPPTPATLVPTIKAISPTSSPAGSATGFALTVNGTNFVATSVINFGGTTPATTFVSSTQLTASIPAAAIASAGYILVTVTSPAPGGGTSNGVLFPNSSGTNPIPAITYPDPTCAPAGVDFNLHLVGTNFVPGSVVRWNGTDLPLILTQYGFQATIPGKITGTAGPVTFTVVNPAPGGGASNSRNFNIASGGAGPTGVVVDPTGKFAYTANDGCADEFYGSVSMFTINPTDGTLTSAGPPVTTGDFDADSMIVSLSGKFAYVANSGGGNTYGSVSIYAVNGTTGILTPTGTTSGYCAPMSLAMHPSGKFAYAANECGFTPTTVSMYTIDEITGALGAIGTVAADGRATAVTVDPSGKFAYVVDGGGNSDGSWGTNVSMYSINAATGGLTSIGKIVTVASPAQIGIHPSGKFAYLVNYETNNISPYTLNLATGYLAFTGTPVVQAGWIGFDPSGKFAYVTRSDGISMYTIDATTGALTFVRITASGSTPDTITFHPSGKFAYGSNYASNTVSIYSVDTSSGSLTLIQMLAT